MAMRAHSPLWFDFDCHEPLRRIYRATAINMLWAAISYSFAMSSVGRSPRDAAFIREMLDLGQHYDGAIGYTEFRGGALQFVGFTIMKVREFEALAQRYGKRFTFDSCNMHAVAVDDVDGPPITPTSPDHFFTTLFGSPKATKGPEGGSVQSLSASSRQVQSAALRNVLASKTVNDVWIKKDTVTVWTIPVSRITNGLFEQAQKAAPKPPKRRKWTVAARRTALAKGKGRRAYTRLREAARSPLKPKSTWSKASRPSKRA